MARKSRKAITTDELVHITYGKKLDGIISEEEYEELSEMHLMLRALDNNHCSFGVAEYGFREAPMELIEQFKDHCFFDYLFGDLIEVTETQDTTPYHELPEYEKPRNKRGDRRKATYGRIPRPKVNKKEAREHQATRKAENRKSRSLGKQICRSYDGNFGVTVETMLVIE